MTKNKSQSLRVFIALRSLELVCSSEWKKMKSVDADDLGACCWPLPNMCARVRASQCIFYKVYIRRAHTMHRTERSMNSPTTGLLCIFAFFSQYSAPLSDARRAHTHTRHIFGSTFSVHIIPIYLQVYKCDRMEYMPIPRRLPETTSHNKCV